MAINVPVTLQEFEKFIHLPENADKRFEYIHGDIVEVVSNTYPAEIAAILSFKIQQHMETQNIKGRVTGPDGGFKIEDNRYIPNFAFVSASRQPTPQKETYNSMSPDFVVEVLSPILLLRPFQHS